MNSNLWRYIDVYLLKFLFSLSLLIYYLSVTEMYSSLKSSVRPACIHKPNCHCSHPVASFTFCFFLSQVKFSHISLMMLFIVWSTVVCPGLMFQDQSDIEVLYQCWVTSQIEGRVPFPHWAALCHTDPKDHHLSQKFH